MRFDKLTLKTQEALSEAQSLATGRGHSQITPPHLLRALLAQPEGSTVPILQKIGVPLDGLQAKLEQRLASLPKVHGGAQPTLAPALNRILEDSFREAEARKDEYVSTEHLLLAAAEEKTDDVGALLREAGATRAAIDKALQSVRGSAPITDQDPESKYQALAKFGRDLTEAALPGRTGKIIVIGEPSRRLDDVLPYLATLPNVIAYNPEACTLTLRRQPGFISLYSDKAYITKVRDTEEGLELFQALVDAINPTWEHRADLVAMTARKHRPPVPWIFGLYYHKQTEKMW